MTTEGPDRAWHREARELTPADRDALAEAYDLSGHLAGWLDLGWPTPLSLGERTFFPSVQELLRRRALTDEDGRGWPRQWLPIGGDGGHLVWFLRSDAPGVWAVFDDQPPPFFPPLTPEWADAGHLLEVLAAVTPILESGRLESAAGLSWISDEAAVALVAAVGEADAHHLLGALGLNTRASVCEQWAADARTAALAGCFTGLMTLGCLGFLLVPTDNAASMASLVLWVGTLPGGLTAYLWWSWRDARLRIRRTCSAREGG